MFRTCICILGSMALLGLSARTALCAEGDGSIPSPLRIDDPRLERTVTVDSDRIALGSLLENLSKQSGVSLRVDERDTLSGVPVFVSLKSVALADAMNGIWSLLGYSGAPWWWQPDGTQIKRSYTLLPSLAAHNLASRLKNEAVSLYDEHVRVMMRVAGMPVEERKKHVADINRSIFLSDKDPTAQNWVEADFLWEGLRTIAESASPELQHQIIHGGASLTLALDKMSDDGRLFVKHYVASMSPNMVNADGTQSPRPLPETITISARRHTVTPTLSIFLHDSGGMSFLGGPVVQVGIVNRLGKKWLLPGDTTSNKLESLVSAPSKRLDLNASEENELANFPVTKAVRQLATSTPLSILGILDDEQPLDPGTPYGQTVEAYLQRVRDYGMTSVKWRGSVLLLRGPMTFVDDDFNIPYLLTKRLTSLGVEGRNLFTLAELATVLANLSRNQIARAAMQYALMREVQRFAPLLAVYYADRDFGRTSGLPLSADLLATLGRVIPLSPNNPIVTGEAQRLRLAVEDDLLADPPVRRFKVQYMMPDRKWTSLRGLELTQIGSATPKSAK